jgi:hypothetical protein
MKSFGVFIAAVAFVLCGFVPIFAQTKPSSDQKTGACSVNVIGNANTVSIKCDGIDRTVAQQIETILSRTSHDAKATKDLSAKLDRLLEEMATAQPPIAIAPNGIANAAPNLGDQTVNNFGLTQYPPPGVIPNVRVCVEPGKRATEGYSTSVTLSTDVRITRPAFMFYFDKPVAEKVSVQAGAFNESRSGRDTNSPQPQNTVGFYITTVGSMSETSWYPRDKIELSVQSQEPVQLVRAIGASGDVTDVNRVNNLAENITVGCN